MMLFLVIVLLSTLNCSMSTNYCPFHARDLAAIVGLADNCVDLTLCKRGGICPFIYYPVCGCDGETYSNYCKAQLNGIGSFTIGECPSDEPTAKPSQAPTAPSQAPIQVNVLEDPSSAPTADPSAAPITSLRPTRKPTVSPRPTRAPTVSQKPTRVPTVSPKPTRAPIAGVLN